MGPVGSVVTEQKLVCPYINFNDHTTAEKAIQQRMIGVGMALCITEPRLGTNRFGKFIPSSKIFVD